MFFISFLPGFSWLVLPYIDDGVWFNLIISTDSSDSPCNCISGVMISVLTSSVVDLVSKSRSSQTKEYKFCVCCF
jgi:hypothetical protein